MTEQNPMWAPIARESQTAPKVSTVMPRYLRTAEAYRLATRPVRVSVSQRYSLVVVEPLPPMVQR